MIERNSDVLVFKKRIGLVCVSPIFCLPRKDKYMYIFWFIFRHQSAQELISHDIRNNTYNYKHTFSVSIVPVCKVSDTRAQNGLIQSFLFGWLSTSSLIPRSPYLSQYHKQIEMCSFVFSKPSAFYMFLTVLIGWHTAYAWCHITCSHICYFPG